MDLVASSIIFRTLSFDDWSPLSATVGMKDMGEGETNIKPSIEMEIDCTVSANAVIISTPSLPPLSS